MKIMKKSGLILLTFLLLMIGTIVPTQASVASPYQVVSVKMEAEQAFAEKNKSRKGFKKRKSKKILGIFKRKSDCGCPKHK